MQQVLPSTNSTSNISKILSSIGLALLPTYYFHLQVALTKSEEVATYVNGLLEFAERMKKHLSKRRRRVTEKMICLLALSMAPSAFVVPFGYVFGLHWLSPCDKKSLIGYWLLQSDELSFLKTGIFMFNGWVWIVGISAGSFDIDMSKCLCTLLLRDCIRQFGNLEQSPGNILFCERVKIYREIQVYGNLLNEVQAGAMMTIIMAVPTIVVSLAIVVIHCLPWTSAKFFVIGLCGYIVFLCVITTIFLIVGQARIWEDSRGVLKKIDRVHAVRVGTLTRVKYKCQQRF